MTEIRAEETQQELFQQFSGEANRPHGHFPSLAKSQKPILFSTSLEQVILAVIVAILAGCLVFFLGVLRGKVLAVSERVLPVQSASPSSSLPRPVPRAVTVAPAQKPVVVLQTRSVAPTAVDLAKPYTIQLVTYKKKDLAEQAVAALRRSGFYAMIIPSQDYFQVCAGQYENKDAAKKDLRFFGGRYKDCFLRRR
ncbi:MAG: SPOR domain-containing protein [Candidatus Omnitrophica bacterium]|nr:SPOR domain-containing protein [Candidatus Omnitrophota bacterium]